MNIFIKHFIYCAIFAILALIEFIGANFIAAYPDFSFDTHPWIMFAVIVIIIDAVLTIIMAIYKGYIALWSYYSYINSENDKEIPVVEVEEINEFETPKAHAPNTD